MTNSTPKAINPMPGGCGYSTVLYDAVVNYLGGEPESILELGCGVGGNLEAFKKAKIRVGIDPYDANVKTARKKKIGKIIKGSHKSLNRFKKDEFEVGVTLSVLCHIGGDDEVKEAIIQLIRACKSLVLIEPYREGENRQYKRGEIKLYKETWLHDYKQILENIGGGCVYKISPKSLYKTNSGPDYHLIEVLCE